MRIGLLTQAQKAKNETENAQSLEEGRLGEYEDFINKATEGTIGGNWNSEKEVNTPVLKENMKLVKWDSTQNKFVPDETNSSYSYDETNKQWANAVVTIEGVESYFVWIPRYEYKINYTTPGTPENGGTIDVKFIPTSQTKPDDGYIIHPAFTNDVENGGWDSELPGIWVGKYETSLVKKSDKSDFSPEGETTIDANTYAITIQPGKSSWRYATIDNKYTMAKSYSTSLNSHMLKNSEWGAVAYLTESKYGRKGTEVTINNSGDYITGSAQTTSGTTIDYKSTEGVLASNTGNVYGIYDLSGGSFEITAAYYTGGSETYLNYGSSLVEDYSNENTKKYVTAYTGTSESTDYKLGDATYETKNWHNDYATFVNIDAPFFSRGGYNGSNNDYAGVFYYNVSDGLVHDGDSFRMCLVIK